jgi:hypothetical protein
MTEEEAKLELQRIDEENSIQMTELPKEQNEEENLEEVEKVEE